MLDKQVKRVVRKAKRVLGLTDKHAVLHGFQRLELYPDWPTILAQKPALWKQARVAAKHGPKVLMATSAGGHTPMNIVESVLAVALTLRGAQVQTLLCDKFLPACMQAEIEIFPDQEEMVAHGPRRRLCNTCWAPGYEMYKGLSLPIHRYSDFVTSEERQLAQKLSEETPHAQIGGYRLDGLAVGEHALAGALRFYARGNLELEPHAEPILRRYFQAALLTTFMARRLFETERFDRACFHHGIYVPQGLIGEVARQRKLPIANWNPTYRKHCFVFSHEDTYHHTLLTEPAANWENIAWTPPLETQILEYLQSRWQGSRDWIYFHQNPQENVTAIVEELGLDTTRPCIGLLTNVIWDAQLHYGANAFPSMLQWLLQTIRHFAARPELQLIIRVHPAEIRGNVPSRQPVAAEIERAFPVLPPNVFVVGPESRVSTYAAMALCNAVIIYGTKTGVELTSMGIPVIVGGEAWIRNKGVTQDARSADEYFQILNQLPLAGRLSDELTQRARKYAFHFFFRRMIPLPFLVPTPGSAYALDLPDIEPLMPGNTPGLDVICEGILSGKEFIYPAETLPLVAPAK